MKKMVLSVKELGRAIGGYPNVTIFSDMISSESDGFFAETMQQLENGLNDAEEQAGGTRKVMRVAVIGDKLALFIGFGNWTKDDFSQALDGRKSFSCMDGSADPETLADQLRTGYRLEL